MVWVMRLASLLEKSFIFAAIICIIYAVSIFTKPLTVATPVNVDHSSEKRFVEQTIYATTGEDTALADVVLQRDLFNASAPGKDINLSSSTPVVNLLPGNFKVVGVIIGTPSQIAIEDVNVHQTFFISKGSQAQGIDVIDILPHQALLKFQGQVIALPLETKL